MLNYIKAEVQKTRQIIELIEGNALLLETIKTIAERCVDSLRAGGKILFAGNGGSAADSQHLAAELVSRLRYNRPALAGIALTTDTSALTAVGNDYSFETLFSRQIEALGRPGDVFIGISTSGKSPNILKALGVARGMSMTTIGLTGISAPLMDACCDYVIHIPSKETAKIQECHIMLGHIICALVEEAIYGAQYNPMRQSTAVLA